MRDSWISVEGVKYPAVVDPNKVLRFKGNRIVRDLLDAASSKQKLDLNMIWANQDNYSREEFLDLYRLIGYSAAGYSEIFAGFNDRNWVDTIKGSNGVDY